MSVESIAPVMYSALTVLTERFSDAWTARQVGQHMTCDEADAVADCMRAVGASDEADAFLRGHANGEDEGSGDADVVDRHHSLRRKHDGECCDLRGKVYDHSPIPDDLPEPGDRCRTCRESITWLGPSTVTDWLHVDDVRNS